MLITKQSALTGITRTFDLNITQEQLERWESGTVAQDAFPNLTADQREFLITGITDEEWHSMQAAE
jgi:hypothetical protein